MNSGLVCITLIRYHVDTLGRSNSRFNLGILKKEDGKPFICYFDDLRWDALGIPNAEFLNLLDGNFVSTEEKYQKRTVQELKGTIAVSTNQPIAYPDVPFEDCEAFKSRLVEINTHPLNIPNFQLPDDFHLCVEKEMIAFAILANAFFLSQNPAIKQKYTIHVPKAFSHVPVSFQPNEVCFIPYSTYSG